MSTDLHGDHASGPRRIGEHAPKRMALEAYADGLLSDEGSARLERHLETCEICREALAQRRSYDELIDASRASAPTIDWERSSIDAVLSAEARRLIEAAADTSATSSSTPPPASSEDRGATVVALSRWRRPVAAAPLAAAALLLGVLWLSRPAPVAEAPSTRDRIGERNADPSSESSPAAPTPLMGESFSGRVVAEIALGDAPDDSPDTPLRDSPVETMLGAELHEGDVLHARGRELHASFAPHAALRLRAGELRVEQARTGNGESPEASLFLGLTGGTVTVVAPEPALDGDSDAPGDLAVHARTRVEIAAAGYRFSSTSALFEVWLDDTRVGVRVAPGGRVQIRRVQSDRAEASATEDVTELAGPGEWSTALPGHVAAADPATEPASITTPLGLEAVAAIRVPVTLPAGTFSAGGWQIGQSRLPAGEARVALPPGPQLITALDHHGHPQEIVLEILPETPLAAEDVLARIRAGRAGSLPPATIQEVIAPSRRQLGRCYELALRRNPDLGGHQLRMRVRVNPRGRVANVRVTGRDALPADLQGCLRRVGSSWRFPEPGGSLTFELPLDLRAR